MFNQDRLKEVLAQYKQDFIPQHWEAERYKWEAVKWFQDNWDINAANFLEMLNRALDKTENLLDSGGFHLARTMIYTFAQTASEELRSGFQELFDESKGIFERIDAFKRLSAELLKKYGAGDKNHFQDENSISTYLWLHSPEKYYIYKYESATAAASVLEAEYHFKRGAYADNIRNYLQFYDEINAALKTDTELIELVKSQLTNTCYPDPELTTLTADVCFYIYTLRKSQGATLPQPPDGDNIDDNAKEAYTKADFLNEVFMKETDYEDLVSVLKAKKNLILQGPPGVGKTFAARRLAWSMMEEKDDNRIEFVQFHQNYSYEDFVMGYKPNEEGFKLETGIFYDFCQKAANQPNEDFFFIIDEINRGNLSKIFGELLMLIENDYRGETATLAYNKRPFSVPKNLYIIGMMNTADRSLAMIDYALRRRFSFFEMKPGFDTNGFKAYQNSLGNEKLNNLIAEVKKLNGAIEQDASLGKGFCIGHSYFCGQDACTDAWLRSVVKYDILPMLGEYWFDDAKKLKTWEENLLGVVQ